MKRSASVTLIFAALFFGSCSNGKGQSSSGTGMKSFGNNSNANVLVGAGSSFVYPMLSKLFASYGRQTGVMVNYQSIGSARGIVQFTNRSVDFCISDIPLTGEQLKKIGRPVLQIPVCEKQGVDTTPKDGMPNRPGGKYVSPATGLTYMLVYKEQNYDGRNLMRAQKLLKMLWWNVHEGRQYFQALNYGKLSPAAVSAAESLLKSATFGGKPILQ